MNTREIYFCRLFVFLILIVTSGCAPSNFVYLYDKAIIEKTIQKDSKALGDLYNANGVLSVMTAERVRITVFGGPSCTVNLLKTYEPTSAMRAVFKDWSKEMQEEIWASTIKQLSCKYIDDFNWVVDGGNLEMRNGLLLLDGLPMRKHFVIPGTSFRLPAG